MPIRYEGSCAVFEGPAIVEEAGDLAGWLIAEPGRAVDLAACTAMHAAVLQCLMALRPAIIAPPQDAALARWLAPLLAFPPNEPEPEPAPEPAPKPARRRRKAPAPRRSAKREAAIA